MENETWQTLVNFSTLHAELEKQSEISLKARCDFKFANCTKPSHSTPTSNKLSVQLLRSMETIKKVIETAEGAVSQAAAALTTDAKSKELEPFRVEDAKPGNHITTNFGTKIDNTDNSLKVRVIRTRTFDTRVFVVRQKKVTMPFFLSPCLLACD